MNDIVSRETLLRMLNYDSSTGIFTWKTRPYRSKIIEGSKAGVVNGSGYVYITLKGRLYRAHRLAWFYSFGTWPKGQIDHINRVKTDNRIINLRIVTNSQNQQNTESSIRNKSGFKGVCSYKDRPYWRAAIMVQGKRIFLGNFLNKEDAAEAYAYAASRVHQFNPSAITNG